MSYEAYCVKCKVRREMSEPQAVFTARGQPALRGTCAVCGTTLYRIGRTPLHEGLTPSAPAAPQREGKLVIVESPTKARTVGRFLGKGYTVRASVGHIRDLLRSQLSVDVEHDFAPKYRVPNEKRAVVKELACLAEKAEAVYLATDPDREGEAIAWHLSEVLGVEPQRLHRVEFHEITSTAIDEAFSHPRTLNKALIDAQQARRVLDRLVGYKLSPLLWAKVRGHLSAGRVQSVALRLIVEREREIEAFVPEEYWTIDVEVAPHPPRKPRGAFKARLARIQDAEVALHNADEAQQVVRDLERARYRVARVKESQRRRRPSPPYTTSTMQQEASRKLGFAARRTMRIAQQLYEGIDLGDGQPVGLITYMRTDSTNVAAQAQAEARDYIRAQHGEAFLPETPPVYKTRARGAQEAHEAIRPTSVFRAPDAIKDYLTREQFRLYELIWRRFVASQMTAALYDTRSVEIEAGTGETWPYLFRASGSVLRFPGFLVVYEETQDEDQVSDEEEGRQPIPPLEEGASLDLLKVLPEQHFTQPPPRYTDASLIRALEEYGIGRPSTYAPILSTLQDRGYVTRDAKRFVPTEVGILVTDLLVEHFPEQINVDFTAQMEAELDQVAAGERPWVEVVRAFYGPFEEALARAEARIEKVDSVEFVGRDCPECGAPLIVRWGRYGKFIGCQNFPTCRYTEAWLEKIGVACPKCGGDLVIKRTRKGRLFYGCAHWPECDFTSWKRPVAQPCPACGGLMVEARKGVVQCTVCQEEVMVEEEVEAVPA